MPESPWIPVSPDTPLAALDGAEVGQGVRLAVEVREDADASTTVAAGFRAFLHSDEFGRSHEPFVTGAFHGNRPGGNAWLRITDTAGQIHVGQGEIEVPDGVDVQVIIALAGLIPPGGHLLMEYDSDFRRTTARALAQGVPPVATPLGGMMYSAGCGVAFTDRNEVTSPGVRRALQGFRALDVRHEVQRAPQMLAELERFMESSSELDWDLQVKCRPVAEATITVLRSRLGVLSREFTLASADGAEEPNAAHP